MGDTLPLHGSILPDSVLGVPIARSESLREDGGCLVAQRTFVLLNCSIKSMGNDKLN
jgi:hypothetical protein